ncbi:MAG: PhoPQ-activated protein PqaA family protein [Flavobacteriales bacterium]
MIKKIILRIVLIVIIPLGTLSYGVLIGKYQVFPYSLLKSLQDNTEIQLENALENVAYDKKGLETLVSVTAATSDSLRTVLKVLLFGDQNLMELKYDTIFTVKDDSFKDLANLNQIEKFQITQKYNIQSIGYFFHPKEGNNRLVLYHQGHDGDFLIGKKTIAYLVDKGFTVYAFSMPLKGRNNRPVVEIPKIGKIQLSNHEEFKYLDHPLQYFIAPVITMLNYADGKKFKDITMVGVSGGGWTTTLAAAMDTRIRASFPVAGTSPMFLRYQEQSRNYGDFEQTFPEVYTKINYLDLYILGATGENRSQTQILNKYDPCCYGGDGYLQYDTFISNLVKKFENGRFQVLSDTTHTEHKISEWSLNQIWSELK